MTDVHQAFIQASQITKHFIRRLFEVNPSNFSLDQKEWEIDQHVVGIISKYLLEHTTNSDVVSSILHDALDRNMVVQPLASYTCDYMDIHIQILKSSEGLQKFLAGFSDNEVKTLVLGLHQKKTIDKMAKLYLSEESFEIFNVYMELFARAAGCSSDKFKHKSWIHDTLKKMGQQKHYDFIRGNEEILQNFIQCLLISNVLRDPKSIFSNNLLTFLQQYDAQSNTITFSHFESELKQIFGANFFMHSYISKQIGSAFVYTDMCLNTMNTALNRVVANQSTTVVVENDNQKTLEPGLKNANIRSDTLMIHDQNLTQSSLNEK